MDHFVCSGLIFSCNTHVLNARVSLRTKSPRRPQWGRRGYKPVSPCKVLAARYVHKMGPATSTHFTRVVHVILMLVLHQSDVNFFVDVAGSCVYAAGPNLWTSRIAKTLHGDTGLYPRRPHCGRRGFFVLRDTRAFNTCVSIHIRRLVVV